MEKFYQKKTSINLNLFGQLRVAWSDAIISNSRLIYAGNNTFHLIAQVGRQLLLDVNGGQREIDLYFAAEADLTSTALQLGSVDLHCVLQARGNQNFGKYIANFLGLITTGPNHDALVQSVKTVVTNAGATELLHLTFNPSAYARLLASTITNGKPGNQTADEQNYAAFANACSDLFTSSPANFTFAGQRLGYTLWSNWNIASNDQWPPSPGALPDRTQSGDAAAGVNYLNLEFPQAGTNAALIGYALQAASDFMNFCEDLKTLATLTTAPPQLDAWDKLLARLQSMMKNDVSPDFVAPVALALTQLCAGGTPPAELTGPAPNLTDKNSIAITVTYS